MDNQFQDEMPEQKDKIQHSQVDSLPTATKQHPQIQVEESISYKEIPQMIVQTYQPSQNSLESKNNYQKSFLHTLINNKKKNTRLEQLKQLEQRVNILEHKVQNVQKVQKKIQKQRRHRRKNSQLQKNISCSIANCRRRYGSETALKAHLRQKHPLHFIAEDKQQNQ